MKFEEMVHKYYKLVYKICLDMLELPQDAEDAVQDTYLNMYKNLERYNSLNENEVKNLICKIALNRCKDILKSKSYNFNKASSENEILEIQNYIEESNIEENIFINENKEILLKNILDLKTPYNKILKYYFIDNISLDELAKKMNISKSTLKVKIYRGKSILKEKLIKDKGGGYFEEYGYRREDETN